MFSLPEGTVLDVLLKEKSALQGHIIFCGMHNYKRHFVIFYQTLHTKTHFHSSTYPGYTLLAPITVTIYLHFFHPLSFTSFPLWLSPSLVFSSSRPGGDCDFFSVHFLARGRLSSAARAILSPPNNTVFSLTLIKVHLASKCCRPLNTDCAEKRKWKKRQSKWCRQREKNREGAPCR